MSRIRLVKKVVGVFVFLFCSHVFADDFPPNLEELEELEKLGEAQELLQNPDNSGLIYFQHIVAKKALRYTQAQSR